MKDMLPGLFQGRMKKRRLRVPDALEALAQEEEQKLIDMESVARAAVDRVQQAGIIFIDEIDKVAGREGGQGPDVSREGVQRDILPIVEGTTVNTKYGMVKTDHILFIAAGAFHVSKPSDLIPELQGRFPIRVELEALGREDFVRILTEPKSALIKQYTALLSTEGVTLRFTDDAVGRIADFATLVNERTENIGARRLHTVMEKLLDHVSFEAPDLAGQGRHDRRGLRGSHARRHRRERRPVPVHSVIGRVGGVVVLAALAGACGKKGPPLAPLHLVPNAVTAVSARRTGDTMRIAFTVPSANLNGPGPVQIDRIEVYAATLAPGATLPTRDLLTSAYRVGTIAIKPAPVEGEPAASPTDTRPAPGESAAFVETLTPETLTPVTLPAPRPAAAPPPSAAPAAVAPLPEQAERVYVIRGVTKSGRGGQPSARVQLPVVEPPAPPSDVKAAFTASAVTLAWTPPAGAGAAAFNVYRRDGTAPLNGAPLTAPAFEQPSVSFGTEACFVVRTVETAGTVPIESAPSEPACVTPVDIFPPAAPERLQVVPTPGAMNLSWQPNTETDLAGYIVLRADAPGGTLQALTPEPIASPRFEDRTARPGERYAYVVVAVDRATPRNSSAPSNRVEETAR